MNAQNALILHRGKSARDTSIRPLTLQIVSPYSAPPLYLSRHSASGVSAPLIAYKATVPQNRGKNFVYDHLPWELRSWKNLSKKKLWHKKSFDLLEFLENVLPKNLFVDLSTLFGHLKLSYWNFLWQEIWSM